MTRRSDLLLSKTATAALASGDRVPSRQEITAPAPSKSSYAERRLSSSCQRSPHGMTETRGPQAIAAFATAIALRRHPANVGVSPVERDSVEPFGEGRTIRLPVLRAIKDSGEREYCPLPRGPANSAPTDFAKPTLESSFHLYGNTVAPFATAIVTAVENDITSTMMTASLIGANNSAPFSPHSHRTLKSD